MEFPAGQFVGLQNRHGLFDARKVFRIFQRGFVALVPDRPDNGSFHAAGRMRLVADRFNPGNHILDLLFRCAALHDNNHTSPLKKKAMAFRRHGLLKQKSHGQLSLDLPMAVLALLPYQVLPSDRQTDAS